MPNRCAVEDLVRALPSLIAAVRAAGGEMETLNTHQVTLEDVFLADQAVQSGAGGARPGATADDGERRPGGRYIDWVIPGLTELNLMWGVGFGLVQARNQKQLKCLVSTPMRKRDYLLAMILARLVFIVPEGAANRDLRLAGPWVDPGLLGDVAAERDDLLRLGPARR